MPERAPVAPVQLTVHSIFRDSFFNFYKSTDEDRKAFAKVLHRSNFYVEFRTVVLF
jgi:hypothetical protein